MIKIQLAKLLGIPVLVLFFLQAHFVLAANDSYSQLSVGRTPKINPTFFGIHIHRLVLSDGEQRQQTDWPNDGIGALRLWDSTVRWADIAPAPGEWNFSRFDTYVNQAIKHHAEILYVLGSPPKWASSRPDEPCPYGVGCAAPPSDMGLWEEYVRRVAQRYRGKIAAYELWNEPFFTELKSKKGSSDFFYGSVVQMVELARVARKVLDQTDPKALLVSPGFTGNINQLELFLSSGGNRYVQVIAYHFYASDTRDFARELAEVRAVMKRQGVQNLPLWNTETGIEVPSNDKQLAAGVHRMNRYDAASRMAQFITIGAVGGVSRYYYYAWDNDNSGMLSAQGTRYPAWDGFEKMQAWLSGATMQGCEAIASDGVRCDGDLNGQHFAIAWAAKESPQVIRTPEGLKLLSSERLFALKRQTVSPSTLADGLMIGPEPTKVVFGPK